MIQAPGSHEGHTLVQNGSSPTGMTADEETAYSLFMHRSSGIALVALGILVLCERLRPQQRGMIRVGIGLLWLVFGAHLFIRSDPEGWPIGPAGFLDSFSMPTAGEWIQHKVLSLIPISLGIRTLVSRPRMAHPAVSWILGGVLALGGAGLLFHQHLDHQTMDLVNLQHRFMALTALFIAASSIADGLRTITWKPLPFLLPAGLVALGLQLALYVE
jgi:copper resistance protein D